MKVYLRIVVVVLTAIAISFGMYFVSDSNSRKNENARSNTTVTKAPVTEKLDDRILLAEAKKEDYRLYKQGDLVVLVHEGKDYTFENWSKYIDLEKPQIVIDNIDKDPEKEILIKMVGDVVEKTGERIYDIYVLNEAQDEKTNEKYYFVTLISNNTWIELLNIFVKMEISQLETCDKAIQVALAMSYSSINYDRDTGIADGYTAWFRALQDENGNYLKIKGWTKGVGQYTIEGDHVIKLQVPIYIQYEDTDEVQQAGVIKAHIGVTAEFEPFVFDHSMSFVASDDYLLHNRKIVAEKAWSFTEANSNTGLYSGGDKLIDYISYKTAYTQKNDKATTNFATNDTELNALSQIKITESYAELAAKSGYTFDEELVSKRKFKVIITDTERPGKKFDIVYDGKIRTDKSGNQILRINFDKKYPKENIETLEIVFSKE